MASVNEWIVREYFECLGFLVRQPRKYQVPARTRIQLEEQADLLVINPAAKAAEVPALGVWDSKTLRSVSRAVVGVRGWHTERFSPAVLRQSPEVYRFAGDDVLAEVRKDLGEGKIARVLCLSGLPATKRLKEDSLHALKTEGIDGVLLYPNILLELVKYVEVNRNYDKSDLLQLLRILKNYDLFKDRQLELFQSSRSRRG